MTLTHLSAYRRVLSEFSEQLKPGETVAIIQVRALGPTNESRKTLREGERERGRKGERERKRETERKRDRKTQRQKDTESKTETETSNKIM